MGKFSIFYMFIHQYIVRWQIVEVLQRKVIILKEAASQ